MNVSIWISAAGLVRVAAAATISPREFSRWAPLTFRNYERRRILLKFRAFYRVEDRRMQRGIHDIRQVS